MMKLNLIAPKAEPTADPRKFILPLWQDSLKLRMMTVTLYPTFSIGTRYTLKKVIVFLREN